MQSRRLRTMSTAAILAAAAAVSAAGLLSPGCGHGPFDDVSITAVELRQAPRLEFLRARVGMKFLEVRFEMENRAKEPLSVKALDFSLRDTAGTVHPYSAQVLDMGQPPGTVMAEVPAGGRMPGSVVFQIPQTSDPAQLIYRRETGGGLTVRLTP